MINIHRNSVYRLISDTSFCRGGFSSFYPLSFMTNKIKVVLNVRGIFRCVTKSKQLHPAALTT